MTQPSYTEDRAQGMEGREDQNVHDDFSKVQQHRMASPSPGPERLE
jgi:hypothetical protein